MTYRRLPLAARTALAVAIAVAATLLAPLAAAPAAAAEAQAGCAVDATIVSCEAVACRGPVLYCVVECVGRVSGGTGPWEARWSLAGQTTSVTNSSTPIEETVYFECYGGELIELVGRDATCSDTDVRICPV